MRKKNTLYTVNKWNRPAFLPQENIFSGVHLDTGQMNRLREFNLTATPGANPISTAMNMSGLGSNGSAFNIGANVGTSHPEARYGSSTGITSSTRAGEGGSSGGGSKGGGINWGQTAMGIAAAIPDGPMTIGGTTYQRGLFDAADPLYHLAGGKESGVGNAASDAGVSVFKAGAQSGNGYMMLAGAGLKALGSLWNGALGIKWNNDLIKGIESNTSNMRSAGTALGQVSDSSSFFDAAGNMASGQTIDWRDLGSTGWLRSNDSLKKKARKLQEAQDRALAYQTNALANSAVKIDNIMDDDIMSNFAALGGPIDTLGSNNMGAIEYGFMSDYLATKKKQAENKNQMTNMFMGTPSTMFADGGGIHIKPSHRGRLTELKERTGKTEAELYNDGNPAHKKMVVFARSARKWNKHEDGGPLNVFYQEDAPLFAFGGDMQTNSADFPSGLTHIDAGGSHSENPYDGVQMGVDQNGTPNLVEENETVWNDYVFSARIPVDEETKKKFHLPRKKEITYAEVSKKLEKEIAERVNDPISQAGFNAQMQTLAEEQERQKQEMEAEKAKAAFEALSPEEQTALMQRAAQEEAMQQQAMQEQTMAQQQAQPSPEEIAMAQQQQQMGQPEVVEGQPMMAEGGHLFKKGGDKKNVGTWKNDKENHWDVFTKPGLKRYIEGIRERLKMAPDEETKTAIRKEAMNELNTLQQSYYDYVRDGAANSTHGYDDNILKHQKMFDRLYGNTGFYTTDENGNIKNLIADAINLPKGAATEDKPSSWFDGYNGPRTSIRNFGSTAYGDNNYYKDLIDDFADLGLTYAPNDNWKDDKGTLYGLSIPEIEAANEAAESTPKVWDWNTGSWINKPTETTSEQPIITTSTPSPQTSDEETNVAPRHKAEWMRYAGLFGPAVGLGLQMAGVGKPDYSGLEAALEGSGDVALADYKPLGDYLTYRPMDIWYEQNALNAQARATDRALSNTNSPSKAAGILANGYNSQIASGDLYRKALEYNDALREKVANFNRGTNQFNAEAYNKTSQFNADARNRARQYRNSLALQAAEEKLNRDAGWYNSLYGNLSGLFSGLSELGRENAMFNMIADSSADGVYGNLGDSYTGQRVLKNKKSALGGRIKNRGRLKL